MFCQVLVAPPLLEQRVSDLLSQALHLLRDGRLRLAKLNGRCGKTGVGLDGREGTQEFKVKGAHVLALLMGGLKCEVQHPIL